jgi:hypothetical protein
MNTSRLLPKIASALILAATILCTTGPPAQAYRGGVYFGIGVSPYYVPAPPAYYYYPRPSYYYPPPAYYYPPPPPVVVVPPPPPVGFQFVFPIR